jgi:16S rRNA (cytidine1402-2'-O)-methyltransferase
MPGTLFVVATPIGNLEDITARAIRVLREAAIIAAEDTRRTAHLLARYAIATPTTSLHAHNEHSKSRALIGRLLEGQNVALVSDAGTPTVSDPGLKLIQDAIGSGIRVEPIPGPSAPLAALTASGIAADSFTFLGFPPTRAKDRKKWFAEVEKARHAVVFFEAPHRLRATLGDLLELIGDQQVVIARELTKTHEELVRGPISLALDRFKTPIGEFTIIINGRHIPEYGQSPPPDAATLLIEIGELTNNNRLSPRQAAAAIAKRHNLGTNAVYALMKGRSNKGE